MEEIINTIGVNNIIIISLAINFILLIAFWWRLQKISKLDKKYKEFMQKIRKWQKYRRRFRKLHV